MTIAERIVESTRAYYAQQRLKGASPQEVANSTPPDLATALAILYARQEATDAQRILKLNSPIAEPAVVSRTRGSALDVRA